MDRTCPHARASQKRFRGKVIAFNAGFERLGSLSMMRLEASMPTSPLTRIIFRFCFRRWRKIFLGLVGTPFKEGANPTYDYRFVSIEHVSGACQLSRRECFAEIGGYTPIKGGGIDYVAVVTARMKGWKTRTYTEKAASIIAESDMRKMALLSAKFKMGAKDYNLGNHPAWEVFRTFYQMTKKPTSLVA